MKNVKCPHCGKTYDLDEARANVDLVSIITMADTFGRESSLVWAYVELFSVTPLRRHLAKIRRILTEVKSLFDAGTFRFQGKTFSISRAGIVEALNHAVHKYWPTMPTNHNYLKTVMVGIAEKERQAKGKRDEAKLRKKEEGLRQGETYDDSGMSDEEREENKGKIRGIINGL